ncbi:MAG: hypothetical protein M3O86_02455 [Actinomycetota bacterium]|nr:hypothetical protein [Actinomycetota bacterium]
MSVRVRLMSVFLVCLLMTALSGVAGASGPEDREADPVDGPVEDGGHQHGGNDGHLPASSANVDLVGRVDLTGVAGGIADVAAFGNYAYLNAFSPECAGRPGAQGTGVHVVDISNPASPTKVGFLPAEANSYVGEGVHVVDFNGRHILVHNNETCNGNLPVTSGIGVWDVTNPLAPVKLGQFGDTTPAISRQAFHTTHSVQAFVLNGRAYAVAADNQEVKDVDIFDLTPAITGSGPAVLVSETGIENFPGAQGRYGNGDTLFHHDMQVKVIDGHTFVLVSYWDAGQILLNIDDPANPVFVTDSDFSSPDLAGFRVSEGNSHQSYWSQDGRFILSSDEDFSPFRTLFQITSGANSGPYGAGEFGWTEPIESAYGDAGLTGSTVFGGSGCEEDANSNGTSDRAEVPSASSTGASVIVFSRGVCFFSKKVESGKLAGYDAVIVGQSHGGTRNGLVPDSFICGSKGHAFDSSDISAICVGHRAMHLLFDDAPAYTGPEGYAAGGDLPAIGTLGQSISARTVFDGWGYVRLHDGATLQEIDAYAVPEALDPAFASGFGNLTVHEVKTDPRANKNLAYFSYYDAGLRIAKFGTDGITEVGHFIAEGGNDFWGVFPLEQGQALLNDRDRGRGRDNAKRPLLLMSDRDTGLWILRYTGNE